ncbi:MAG: hypothetical protein CMK92_13650 [Pseudomonas sp.]|nr:hypothetical protein [Pseudomonas sp.]
MSSFDDFIDDLTGHGADREEMNKKATKGDNEFTRKQFTCESCGGSGLWRGGRNSHGNDKCHTCHGKGFLVTDPKTRAKARARAAEKKVDARRAAITSNIEAMGGGVLGSDRLEALREAGEWSEFAASLYAQHRDGKAFSEKQAAAATRMLDKLEANRKAKAQAANVRRQAAPTVDLAGIKAMFEAAVASGYKRPKYRAEGFVISLAPAHGANAGHLYVKSVDDVYMGKITPEMKFLGVRDAEGSGVEKALAVIAADPKGAAVRYGAKTGECSCCGRTLTDPKSIEAGIGPICADRWGF